MNWTSLYTTRQDWWDIECVRIRGWAIIVSGTTFGTWGSNLLFNGQRRPPIVVVIFLDCAAEYIRCIVLKHRAAAGIQAVL